MADSKDSETALEDQLHQQLSENDNNRNSIFTSFIVGIIALFGFYGYVFVNTNKRSNWNFDIQEFLLMSFVTIGILFFLAILALNLGYSFRRDQFIVYKIRKKRYKTGMEKIFGKIYSPYNKNRCSFLPDYYNLFYWLFFASEVFLHITAIIKIYDTVCICKYKCIIYIIMLLHFVFIISTLILRFCCYYRKYEKITENCPR
jgi:hypothetical protein